jgi:putative hydrolase of the HAD superfamily
MVFWNAAAPGKPTEGIAEFLDFLKEKSIRTGVISNITYCSEAVNERINNMVPNNTFEFIIATSDYIYRKPHSRIFKLALEKADLKPEEVWYIGDNYECDVKGAAGVGMFPVWYQGAIDLPYKDDEAVLAIKSWQDLMKTINEI